MIFASVVGLDGVVRNMDRLKQDLGATRAQGLVLASLMLRRELALEMTQASRYDPFWGKTGAVAGLARRTGGTVGRLSPGGHVFHQGGTAFSAVGSPDAYVKELEEGGSSSAGAGYFRIPTAAAQTGAGVDRMLGRSFRDVVDGFLIRSKSGRLWGVQRQGKGSSAEATGFLTGRAGAAGKGAERLVFLYLFVKSIRHSAHHVFAITTEKARPKVLELLGAQVALTVRRHA